jgi:hypothetical protein
MEMKGGPKKWEINNIKKFFSFFEFIRSQGTVRYPENLSPSFVKGAKGFKPPLGNFWVHKYVNFQKKYLRRTFERISWEA